MKKTFQLFLVLLTVGIASCSRLDNPVTPEPQPTETPEQQAFWAPFDAWQTDSCTAGDDFYMHMIGAWWKNPVDVYPDGLIATAQKYNNQRVKEIRQTNADLVHLKKNGVETPEMNDDQMTEMVTAKVEELWADAETREEALAALGRAWAQGYTMDIEPIVVVLDGVPMWQLNKKYPSYTNEYDLFYSRQERARAMAPRPNARLKNRAAMNASADLDIIVKAMNIGVDHIDIAEDVLETWLDIDEKQLSTAEDIRYNIVKAVMIEDGALVNQSCAALALVEAYNYFISENKFPSYLLDVKTARSHVYRYMASLYALKDYNAKYITPKARQTYKGYCEDFREAMRQRLLDNQWLEDATRQNAIAKLDNIDFYVGGIDDDGLPECVTPQLTGKDFIEDARQLRKARMDGYRWSIGKSRKATTALMDNLYYISDLTADNAFYYPDKNIVLINPSNICEPYMQEDYEYVLQLAYIATTIGHELTHGFDSEGSKYDKWGNLVNWWTDADAKKFKARCNQLIENYNGLQLMPWQDPTLYGDGKKTLTENIADLGGCCLGLHILLNKYRNAKPAEKKTLTKRYFQGWAIQWSKVYDLEDAIDAKGYDTHSLSRERTNGVVRNMNEWYDAYDITSGTLFLPPSERVEIW